MRAALALSEGGAYCPRCGKSLNVDYDYELAAQRIRETPMHERPLNIWFLEELLPIHDAVGPARVGEFAGFTPLTAPTDWAQRVGLRNLYLKDDSTSRPSLSYKDRVVGMAVARLLELGRKEIGCVSTGNVGTAVAALAAKAGVAAYSSTPTAWRAPRPTPAGRSARRCVRSRATTTKPTKPAARLPKRRAWSCQHHAASLLRRGREDRGVRDSRQQLGWRSPDRIVSPAAGARSPRESTRG